MKEIPLTQGYTALVNDEDYEEVMQYKWSVEIRKNTCYASSNLRQGRNATRMRLHRFLLKPSDDVQIDHKDRNGLNCQRDNLRLANHQNNGRNIIQPQGVNGTGYRGVSYYKDRKDKFVARIRDDTGYKLHLGCFDTAEDAARAYDNAARKYHKEFAVLNGQHYKR